ncbi:MAG: site-specific DNA-methyltransferase [Flavobacteriales bacterium]|nr:site-specific DNA-methyltransferase [Flavobacteriales bacterium]
MPTLQFKGKSFVQNHHLAVKFHQLVGVKGKSLTDKVSLHDNLIVQGDNLKALKALLPTHAGKVKCIYIDPPYNTGNEKWVYNDNVNSPMMQEWLGAVVDKDDLTRHDKWLCMMMPRLKLLKELLAEDGAIFVSIDNNEVHRLRLLLDEVFGLLNFEAQIEWQNRYSVANDHTGICPLNEHLVAYAKSDAFVRGLMPRTEENDKLYRLEDENGVYRPDNYTCNKTAEERPNLYYPIKQPNTGEEIWPKKTAVWRYTKETHAANVKADLVYWGKDGKSKVPSFKRYRHALRNEGKTVPHTWWTFEFAGHTDGAKKELYDLFTGGKSPDFYTVKPVSLIERVLQITTDDESLILDSFAGSGTTAHAVLKLNKEDGGNRRFILVEMEDYADSITAERVRRVIKGVPKSKNFQEGTGGSFSYFKLGAPIEMEHILHGDRLPTYEELARYVYYTATGEEFNAEDISKDPKKPFIGTSKNYPGGVYLFYEEKMDYLMNRAFTLDMARALGKHNNKRRLVFAPMKYLDQDYLDEMRIDYSQLPFEIYKFKE